MIPRTRMSPIALAIAALYPLPNRSTPGQNYVSSPTQKDRDDQFDLRLDHNLNKSSELSFHYSLGDRDFFEPYGARGSSASVPGYGRSEEHTSELQSPMYLVCRLLLEKKKKKKNTKTTPQREAII